MKPTIQELKLKQQKVKKELEDLKTKYFQTQQCLQNWKGKFKQSEFEQFLLPLDHTPTFVLKLCELKIENELVILTFPNFLKESLTDAATWQYFWLIGFSEQKQPNQFSNLVGTIGKEQQTTLEQPMNFHIAVAKELIQQKSINTQKLQDEFTLHHFAKIEADETGAELCLFIAELVSIKNCEVQLKMLNGFQLPADFVVLDIKVYHPCVESIINLHKGKQ